MKMNGRWIKTCCFKFITRPNRATLLFCHFRSMLHSKLELKMGRSSSMGKLNSFHWEMSKSTLNSKNAKRLQTPFKRCLKNLMILSLKRRDMEVIEFSKDGKIKRKHGYNYKWKKRIWINWNPMHCLNNGKNCLKLNQICWREKMIHHSGNQKKTLLKMTNKKMMMKILSQVESKD